MNLQKAATAAGLVLALVGCGTTPAGKPAASSPSQSQVPAASSVSCTSQLSSWAHDDGGTSDVRALGKDSNKLGSDDHALAAVMTADSDTSAETAAITADASQLGADAQTALANQPPACVPGADAPYRAAMAEYSQSSQDELAVATQIQDGNDEAAIPNMTATTTAVNKANADMSRATAAITTFNNDGS